MTRYSIDITPTSRYVLATIRGDFPGVEAGTAEWRTVVDAARERGLDRVVFVRFAGRPPDAVGFVDTVRRLEALGMRGWRVAVVFWDAERMVEEYQFVTALARHLGFELAVCETLAEAEAFVTGAAAPRGDEARLRAAADESATHGDAARPWAPRRNGSGRERH